MDENMKVVFRRPVSEKEKISGLMLLLDVTQKFDKERVKELTANLQKIDSDKFFGSLMQGIELVIQLETASKILGFKSFEDLVAFTDMFGNEALL